MPSKVLTNNYIPQIPTNRCEHLPITRIELREELDELQPRAVNVRGQQPKPQIEHMEQNRHRNPDHKGHHSADDISDGCDDGADESECKQPHI